MVSIALIMGALGTALALVSIILHAANWRPTMAKSPTAQQLLSDIAALETGVTTLIANAAEASGEADLQEVAAALAPVKAAVDAALAPPAPPEPPVSDQPPA